MTRAEAKASTRAAVIAGAVEFICTRGAEALTVRDLARHIGRSTGAIFCHFSGIAAVVEEACRRDRRVVSRMAQPELKKLRDLVHFLPKEQQPDAHLFCAALEGMFGCDG